MALKRVLTLKQALAINIGAIIGAGIFTISGLAAGIAGPATIIAIAIGAIISLLTGLSFAQLASVYSKEGGNYEYAKSLIGRYAGVVVGFLFIMASIIGGAFVALSFGSYFNSLFGLSIGVPIVGAVLIVLLSAVNYFGVRHSADASLLLTVMKLIILAFFIIVGIFYIKPGNYIPFVPNGLGSMFEASAFIFFAYTGFARVTTLGEEVKDPKRTIPRAIIYSVIISAIIYVAVMSVLIGIAPYKAVAASQAPLEFVIQYATHNALVGYIIAVGALFATMNVVLSMTLGISRVTFAMARSSDLPRFFDRMNKFGAPDSAIIVSAVVMLAAIFTLDFKQIAALSNASALFGYSIANASAIKLVLGAKRATKGILFKSKYFIIIPIAGIISAAALLLFLTAISLYLLLAILALATVYYLVFIRGH